MGYIVGIVVFIIAVLHNPNDPNKNVGKLKSNLGIEKQKGFGNLDSKSLNSNLFSKTNKAAIQAQIDSRNAASAARTAAEKAASSARAAKASALKAKSLADKADRIFREGMRK